MGISSALFSGVSGLNTNANAMSVIGNNLANTNTVGFKGSRSVFSDLLSANISGSGGKSQVGRGVAMSTVDQIFSQGTFETTESSLDVAVEGDGFFILKEPDNLTAFYSRAGAFRFDDDGFLVNPEGFRVQGLSYDAAGNLTTGDAGDIEVTSSGLISGNVTTEVTLTTNLDSRENQLLFADFDVNDPDTYNYASSVQVIDSLGNPQLLTTYFIKTGVNTWSWGWSAEKDDGSGDIMSGAFEDALEFNTDGVLLNSVADPPVDTIGTIPSAGVPPALDYLSWNNGTTDTDIVLTFDTTQFNSESAVISLDQNGYGSGNLLGVDIDQDGLVLASYSNGEQVKIAQLVLGRFVNPNGLELTGKNLYVATTASGPPRTGVPGPELGKIFTNSLEQSNVDMGAEFVRMITVQRGFQANSKIITTVDELLGELINLKR